MTFEKANALSADHRFIRTVPEGGYTNWNYQIMTSKAMINITAVKQTDIYGSTIHPGDKIISVTSSHGRPSIKKAIFLGIAEGSDAPPRHPEFKIVYFETGYIPNPEFCWRTNNDVPSCLMDDNGDYLKTTYARRSTLFDNRVVKCDWPETESDSDALVKALQKYNLSTAGR